MSTSQAELITPKEGEELRLSEDGTIRVAGGVKNPLPGPATIALLFIQPNQCPIMKSVNVEIKEPGTKKGQKEENNAIPFIEKERERENLINTQVTIKVVREDSDGMLSCQVFTI